MSEFIQLLLIASACIFGVHCVFSSGYIFNHELFNKLPDAIYKPLIGCPPCMASVHGLAIGLFQFGFSWKVFPFIVCLCGLNYVIKSIIWPEYKD